MTSDIASAQSFKKQDIEPKQPRTCVGVFIFNEKNELFLMKSTVFKDLYIPPGGGVEYNETIEEAAKREVMEETGMEIGDIKFISVSEAVMPKHIFSKPNKHLILLNYKASAKDIGEIKLNHEASGYKWLDVKSWLKKNNINHPTLEVLKNYLSEPKIDCEYQYKRALADYQNLLKRTSMEKQEFAKYANEQFILEILPVYDNLKISLKHIDEAAQNNGWAEGIKYVVKQFKDALNNLGVEEIKTEGEKFDHNTMEAIEGQGKRVKREARPGYKLNGKVIIAAKVVLE